MRNDRFDYNIFALILTNLSSCIATMQHIEMLYTGILRSANICQYLEYMEVLSFATSTEQKSASRVKLEMSYSMWERLEVAYHSIYLRIILLQLKLKQIYQK